MCIYLISPVTDWINRRGWMDLSVQKFIFQGILCSATKSKNKIAIKFLHLCFVILKINDSNTFLSTKSLDPALMTFYFPSKQQHVPVISKVFQSFLVQSLYLNSYRYVLCAFCFFVCLFVSHLTLTYE